MVPQSEPRKMDYGEPKMNRPTVTLCMIVKDEEHIIHECLDSMKEYVDRFDITDTGSSDRTKEIIREWGEKNNIPGTVYDHPWEGFGKSRTASLRNADKGGADYSWVIDADDRVAGDFKYPENFGEADSYALQIHRGDFTWWRNQIFKNNVGWEYVGVIHEYADAPKIRQEKGNFRSDRISGDYNIDARTMGNRTQAFGEDQSKKYSHDAEVLLDCLTNPKNINYEPDNVRYKFYLAQSYFDAGQYEKAYDAYQKRAEAGGWEEEVWYSIYRMGICKMMPGLIDTKDSWQIAQDHFLQAWNYRPTRIEPLYQLSRIHRQNGNPRLGYMFAKSALGIPFPNDDILFLQKELYDWMIYDEIAATAAHAGDMMLGLQASMKLVKENIFSENERERIMNNYNSYAEWGRQKEAENQKNEIETKAIAEEDRKMRAERQKAKVQEAKINKRRGKKVKVR